MNRLQPGDFEKCASFLANVHNMASGATLHCRVQYLDDIDPFSSTTNLPEPTRPPKYTFINNISLSDQIPGVHRILSPPHQVKIDLNAFRIALNYFKFTVQYYTIKDIWSNFLLLLEIRRVTC